MHVVICESPEQVGALAADAVESLLAIKADAVLGLATGSSPLGTYAELARRYTAGRLSLAGVTAFLLDEYVGLPPGHPQLYRQVIERDLLAHVDLDPARVHSPDGNATDLPAEAAAYEQAIAAAGGIDLQLLGLGTDGHIAFNEPGSSLGSRTRIKSLTEQTRADNARFFGGDLQAVPRHCLTQGIGTIMAARHIVLIATGPGKAAAVRQLIEGPVTAMCPASTLQFHPYVRVLVDESAAADLQLASYYRQTYAAKPEWPGRWAVDPT